jgi:hypothetical protein
MIERLAAPEYAGREKSPCPGPRSGRSWPIGLILLAATCRPAAAETLLYSVEIPDGQSVTYEVLIDVEHPGDLVVEAEWSGGRSLALKLQSPVGVARRRAGVSPLRLETRVEEGLSGGEPWKLSIHALPMNGGGDGRITISLPDAPGAEKPVSPTPSSPVVPPPPPEPWTRPRRTPAGSPVATGRVFETTESFRRLVIEEPVPDTCRWQTDLLRFLADRRDGLGSDPASAPATTVQHLESIAQAIDRVEELRTSADPMLVGPPPDDAELRAVWAQMRRNRLLELEDELDVLLGSIRRGHAPELADEEWPGRLVSCLTACQRHFAERQRVGEARAINLDLARRQWERVLAAGDALEALVDVLTESDKIVLRRRDG